MPIDRKARSQALGAYTFLPTGKKYSFSCAIQLDAGTLVEYPRKTIAPMSSSAIDDRGHHGANTIATKARSLPGTIL
jgi:hypothetical protein